MKLFLKPLCLRCFALDERNYALLGVIGPVAAYAFIGVAIALSAWFSWHRNALSDLGHAVRSSVAPIFNFGLLMAGLLMFLYAVIVFRKYAKYTSVCLIVSAFMLQMVATFNEVYGFLHFVVSVLFFLSLGIASVAYAVERRSLLPVLAFIMGLGSWALYWARVYSAGVAVPEIVSSTAVVSWIILSAFRLYLGEKPFKSLALNSHKK